MMSSSVKPSDPWLALDPFAVEDEMRKPDMLEEIERYLMP